MKFYATASAFTLGDLQLEVNKMIDKGFEPFGSIFMEVHKGTNEIPVEFYHQPVLKQVTKGKTAEDSWAEFMSEFIDEEERREAEKPTKFNVKITPNKKGKAVTIKKAAKRNSKKK